MPERLRGPRTGERKIGAYGYAAALAGLAAIVILGFCALSFFELFGMRDRDLDRARLASGNLVATIENDISRNLDVFDLSLQAVADNLKLDELSRVSPQMRQVVLFDRAATAKHLGSIRVYDRNGEITADSRTVTPDHRNVANKPYFMIHIFDPNAGLYISSPFVGLRGNYSIAISRRLTTATGEFAGVVVGILRLTFFHNLLSHLSLDPGTVTAVLHTDGQMIMRNPFDINDIGRNIGGSELYRNLQSSSSGNFQAVATIDGVHRDYVYKKSERHPIIVSIGAATDAIYTTWRNEAIRIGSIVAGLMFITVVVMILLARDFRSHSLRERRLSVLAISDGLTGVSNRRHFDAILDHAWDHSIQSCKPMALLMFDCDRFKAYNDRYGHLCGDIVLREVARCIKTEIRPGELAARYGGEEFAAILPDCVPAEALKRAERIRRQLADLGLPHQDNDGGVVTVSIGVACMIGQAGRSRTLLIEAADEALYVAKHAGRNRTEIAYKILPSSSDKAAEVAA